ncbi:MAG: hypothetical protein ABEN55_03250 [Bradymonadaceae bacterium]
MTDTSYHTTTHRLVAIDWAGYDDKSNRRSRWGGHINSWDFEKLDEDVYLIANDVNISEIDEALQDVIRDTDRAVLTYPYGSKDSGASAMRVRIYGKEVE